MGFDFSKNPRNPNTQMGQLKSTKPAPAATTVLMDFASSSSITITRKYSLWVEWLLKSKIWLSSLQHLTSADAIAANQIISSNTLWHAGEVHNLNQSTVQIAEGATLTIERGVEVIGPGSIQTFGVLNVVGGAGSFVARREAE
jgi:hypothetical protein